MAVTAGRSKHDRLRSPRERISMRVPGPDLAEIDRRAAALNMDRTQYMIDASLDRLPEEASETFSRLSDHERRLARLEQLAFEQ